MYYNVEERISKIDSSISLIDYQLTDEFGEVIMTVDENHKQELEKICGIINQLKADNKMLRINNEKLSKDVMYLAKLKEE